MTYSMNTWTAVLHEKLIGPQKVMKFLRVYGTQGSVSCEQPAPYSCPQINPEYALPTYFFIIRFNSILPFRL